MLLTGFAKVEASLQERALGSNPQKRVIQRGRRCLVQSYDGGCSESVFGWACVSCLDTRRKTRDDAALGGGRNLANLSYFG